MILAHTESTQKCLKFERLIQKSCVAGPWEHKDLVSENNKKTSPACVPIRQWKQEPLTEEVGGVSETFTQPAVTLIQD
jgi:hypothetical protein